MKIIIAGDGKVGLTLTQKLSAAGHDLTLIDSNQRVLDSSVERYDVMGVQGNCASMRVLESADVKKADLLIAATSSDEVNLLCGMTAHGLNPRIHTIARIRNPEYGKQIFTMRDVYSLSLMVNPEKQAAREIERLIRYPGFLQRETFAKSRVEIVELRIQKGSKLCDVALMNLENIRIVREMRNDVNRKVNCETANINKTVSAAIRQIEDIRYIEETTGFSSLPEPLEQMARLRLQYPEASLLELGKMLTPVVGKSGVNHRLRKLKEIAEDLRRKQGGEVL